MGDMATRGRASSDREESANGPVQSVDRALQILDLLASSDSLGVSEISRELGVHRSTAFRLLATLESRNFVEQEERRGEYQLGLGVLRLASAVRARRDIVRDAQSVCDALVEEIDETSNVALLEGEWAVNVTQATSTRFIAVSRQYVGQRTPLHATSTGKMLLAHAPGELFRAITGRALEQCTDATITDPAELAQELDNIRRLGWAAAIGEWEEEANAVAVPVIGRDGTVVAALSVTAPSFRLGQDEVPGVVEVLQRHAGVLSARLGGAAAVARDV
ncbi:DNA-binding IclR family transcriptional regulator [Naumannella halotolerans]|uniref:Glycerol operon regulatory protein n=2 Tax=Naumannella halotolerans TaxID=993414 RepID=A0A4R7J3N0_9ACTN|nr:DNA-binding IclR family transcriptional regulator [Naumannella halotolerans]